MSLKLAADKTMQEREGGNIPQREKQFLVNLTTDAVIFWGDTLSWFHVIKMTAPTFYDGGEEEVDKYWNSQTPIVMDRFLSLKNSREFSASIHLSQSDVDSMVEAYSCVYYNSGETILPDRVKQIRESFTLARDRFEGNGWKRLINI